MITREDAKKLLPIMKVFSEGKQIQHFNIDKWEDTDFMPFTDHPSYYRIKPEPKYRPFKNVEECWEEMQKHQPFGWIKHITENEIQKGYFIIEITNLTDFNIDFKYFLFADGTPFGIKEEE